MSQAPEIKEVATKKASKPSHVTDVQQPRTQPKAAKRRTIREQDVEGMANKQRRAIKAIFWMETRTNRGRACVKAERETRFRNHRWKGGRPSLSVIPIATRIRVRGQWEHPVTASESRTTEEAT